MGKSRLPRLSSINDGSFEPSRKNPILLRNDEPLDSHLKQLKVGEHTTPLELSEEELRVNGDIFINGKFKSNKIETIGGQYLDLISKYVRMYKPTVDEGKEFAVLFADNGSVVMTSQNDMTLDAQGDFSFTSEGDDFHFYGGGSNAVDLYFRFDSNNYCLLNVADSGVTTLSTIDADGTGGHLTLDVDGSLITDPADGKYIAKNNGTEFSATDSAYAGMVLGYTCLRNLDNSGGAETITIGTSFATLQTDAGNDVKVTFVAPPSGNVEIVFSALVDAFSKIVYFALSDNATYNELHATHTYDAKCITVDETDENVATIRWFLTGLTAGSSYTYFIGAKVSSSTATIVHGVNRFNAHSPPITVKAIALPNTNYTGQ